MRVFVAILFGLLLATASGAQGLQRWQLEESFSASIVTTDAPNEYAEMNALLITPASSPYSQTSTPDGELWRTNGTPDAGKLAYTLYEWNGNTSAWEDIASASTSLHKTSHYATQDDELRADLLGSGAAVPGTFLEPDGAGGLNFNSIAVSDLPTHATTHQHSGGDEVATATAAANAIPKAGAGGTLDEGWIQNSSETLRGDIELATQAEVNTGTDTVRAVTPATLAGKPLAIPYTQLTQTGDTSTTSATYVQMAGMTSTPPAGTYMAMFCASGDTSNVTADMQYAIFVNGTIVAHSQRHMLHAGANDSATMYTQAVITPAGGQVVEVRYLTSAGTFTVHERSFIFFKIGG